MRFSISRKLLLFILPLLCLPIAIVGYSSIHASVERVDRLVRHEQMVEVKTAADRINDVIYYCRLDLETISRLPVIEDFHMARSFRLEAETEFNHENIVRLFRDFLRRTTYYYQIRYLDNEARELVRVHRDAGESVPPHSSRFDAFPMEKFLQGDEIRISDVFYSPDRKGHLIHYAKPYVSSWGEFAGIIVVDLDFEKIIDIVKAIRVGERGYAFLIDQAGRNTAHPLFEPYRYHLGNYPDTTLRDLVVEMMNGGTGWRTYVFEGEEKVAAFSFIPVANWSVAVTVPSVELKKEAQAIRTRVIQVVLFALIFGVIGVSLLSYYLLRPVRNLVTATNRIADGDLSQEIPVQSRDELGDLTRSFNRMVKNLSRIQNELVRSEKLISLGRLSAGVAHEIRNPLNAMKGAIVHMQRRRHDDSLVQEYTQLVSEEIDRLNRFVSEFLYFAKQAAPVVVPTDINKLLLATQNLFMRQAMEKGIRFHNHFEGNLPALNLDPQQIEQVLVNVIINATDAMPKGGDLTISTCNVREGKGKDECRWIRIAIEDTGCGIPAEHLESVFDPFFSTKETGTGLGLPLSLGIVEAHAGTIKVSTQEEKGTTVLIELPVEPREAERRKDAA